MICRSSGRASRRRIGHSSSSACSLQSTTRQQPEATALPAVAFGARLSTRATTLYGSGRTVRRGNLRPLSAIKHPLYDWRTDLRLLATHRPLMRDATEVWPPDGWSPPAIHRPLPPELFPANKQAGNRSALRLSQLPVAVWPNDGTDGASPAFPVDFDENASCAFQYQAATKAHDFAVPDQPKHPIHNCPIRATLPLRATW
jgi:hypothetical protein